ncbi:MAG: prepilin-type N-terminal cleavage/methylation domain-containing protein [Gammaproteobacteria bacterium]|nr:MAG: type II secretion system protein [Gammaproteobacteria bacterium]UCH41834.1 MAG: prepilin-type N-terminal cleavage/methylation domain-containing protein [Gammaproteobacteria bacterium]
MQYSKQKGFTLVEIAIVLVIVGLLIGGVLKGQEMITNAKLKRVESDNAGIAAAMFSYQDRYLQLPGDDSAAEGRFTVYGVGDPVNGDGSGTIDGVWNVASTTDITLALTAETNMFFAHLRAAGLIPGGGVDDTKPTNAYGGQIGIQDGALNIAGHVTIFGAIEGPIAKIIEARLDDGDGDTGRIQSALQGADMALPASAAAVYDDAQRYDMAFRL